ncbi:hypothetical protein J7I98_22710 [Streptomyces sp. ISL-98]|uniref:hypothetical protein n=1 Tax=Streptomyces sp. ISL-98 TaxID=2819192 RepID=UPI001BEAF219|nr:hypothetical protein [Streptomyces sp. ISL-98]MBT2508641.1 hypothetical protein [Streptomyces sp. ISL-98]
MEEFARAVPGSYESFGRLTGPVVGLEPPLSFDELRAIVTSPRWSVFVDSAVN